MSSSNAGAVFVRAGDVRRGVGELLELLVRLGVVVLELDVRRLALVVFLRIHLGARISDYAHTSREVARLVEPE